MARIQTRIWRDPEFTALRQFEQLLYFYYQTYRGPRETDIQLMDRFRISPEQLRSSMETLQRSSYAINFDRPKFAGRPWIPVSIRTAVLKRDGRRCLVCGSIERLSMDHVIPFSHGGLDTIKNLRVLCVPCNSRRGARV